MEAPFVVVDLLDTFITTSLDVISTLEGVQNYLCRVLIRSCWLMQLFLPEAAGVPGGYYVTNRRIEAVPRNISSAVSDIRQCAAGKEDTATFLSLIQTIYSHWKLNLAAVGSDCLAVFITFLSRVPSRLTQAAWLPQYTAARARRAHTTGLAC